MSRSMVRALTSSRRPARWGRPGGAGAQLLDECVEPIAASHRSSPCILLEGCSRHCRQLGVDIQLVIRWSPHDPPRRRHGAPAVGRRRARVPVGDDPPARGRPRLRLAAARRVRRAGRRRGRRRSRPVSSGRRCATSRRSPWSWRRRRRARRVDRAAEGRRRRRAGERTSAAGPGRGDDRHRAGTRGAATTSAPEFPPVLDLVAPRHRRGRPGRRRRSPPAAPTPGSPSLRTSSAPRSSARSPTPCCSATGTSCSPAWPAGPLLELVRGWRRSGRSRWSRCSARPAWCRSSTARSTTATTGCSAGSGSRARSRPSASCFVTRAALKERAVLGGDGRHRLLYLAILTAFGTDLVARAVLSGA